MTKILLSVLFLSVILVTSTIMTSAFMIEEADAEESQGKLPEWIKDVFVWYGQGQVSENDVLNALAFLVTNEIIKIDLVNDSMSMATQAEEVQNTSWNVDAPIIIPLREGHYEKKMVYFGYVEVSDSAMANMMSYRVNFSTLHIPELKNISEENLAKVYAFTNGISGSEAYGGGMYMYQTEVFDSVPGEAQYSQIRQIYLVTWNEEAKPEILTTESAILKAESRGELVVEKSSFIINAPMIAWEIQGNYGKMLSKASHIPRMLESMPDIQGELSLLDENNQRCIHYKTDGKCGFLTKSRQKILLIFTVDFFIQIVT